MVLPPEIPKESALAFFEGRDRDESNPDLLQAKEWIGQQGDPWLKRLAQHELGLPYEGEDPMKGMLERILFLREVFLFDGLDNRDLMSLSQIAEEANFRAGERLCSAGESGPCLYVLREGEVSVRLRDREVARLGPGECIGEIAVLEAGARTADVVALSPCQTLSFPADLFRGILEARPQILFSIIRLLLARLKATTERAEFTVETVPKRP
jgi:hypothetical protein